MSSWLWPFHPGCGERPYLTQTLQWLPPTPASDTLFRTEPVSWADRPNRNTMPRRLSKKWMCIGRLPPRVNFKENPSLNRSIYLRFQQCNTVLRVKNLEMKIDTFTEEANAPSAPEWWAARPRFHLDEEIFFMKPGEESNPCHQTHTHLCKEPSI